MRISQYYIILLLVTASGSLSGQLSPGDLTADHSHLEGLSNCTQCHDIGQKVPDSKCLACHDEIDQLISNRRGYHASKDVKSKACIDCHSDHHGLKFDMVRFDEENFNHSLTGYELEGEHERIECKSCHKSENIKDAELRRRQDSYLGLQIDCLSCHDDFHQGSLSKDCVTCHDYERFRPASLFDHEDTVYPLQGAHKNVECISCHKENTRNGMTYQSFSDLKFTDCVDCHRDPHNDNLQAVSCNRCHSVQSFSAERYSRHFNHQSTDFELKGKHRQVSCFDCHVQTSNPKTVFQAELGIAQNQCAQCHGDVHESKFGTNCVDCHNESDFLDLSSMKSFNHDLTNYPIEGMHLGLECAACHTTRYTDPINHDACKDCHDDYHRGEFAESGISPDCNQCHTLNEKFDFTLFGFDEHQESSFPLEGAHMATPCFACHVSEEHWTFRQIGEKCVDCHQNVHAGFISDKYYPNEDCASCHNSNQWSEINFDHSLTSWDLVGQHNSLECRSCHFEISEEINTLNQVFNTIQSNCYDCHDNPHGTQFEIQALTDCNRCHDPMSWHPSKFNHDETAFPLEGKHADTECDACHIKEDKSKEDKSKEDILNFKMERFECIDCHS